MKQDKITALLDLLSDRFDSKWSHFAGLSCSPTLWYCIVFNGFVSPYFSSIGIPFNTNANIFDKADSALILNSILQNGSSVYSFKDIRSM